MRSVAFDYPNTCPKIDKEIDKAKGVIQLGIENLLEQACPFMSWPDVQRHATDFAEDMYMGLESCFETVRSVNQDMRCAADDQIEDLIDEVRNLEHELREARSQIDVC